MYLILKIFFNTSTAGEDKLSARLIWPRRLLPHLWNSLPLDQGFTPLARVIIWPHSKWKVPIAKNSYCFKTRNAPYALFFNLCMHCSSRLVRLIFSQVILPLCYRGELAFYSNDNCTLAERYKCKITTVIHTIMIAIL